MVVGPFEKFWLEYDKWYDEHPNIYRSELWAVELASRGVPRPWVEIGVGSGRFAAPLGVDVGLDPSERLLELASRRGVRVVRGLAESTPFPDGSFGGVFVIITICFLDEPLKALREARRILKPEGRLVVGFIPSDSPWGTFYSRLKERGHKFYSHARFYSLSELTGMLELSGFETELLVSTLRSPPGSPEVLETPVLGLAPGASFLVIRARVAR
ncbi:class I SAM-dependent methyltransferase [Thermogladius sp. KZ2Tp1]|uniref:class I SAM-dependent methyltransferase n=1 Tax=Thermogladius sp. KZ2Tp1 TaxID=3136289 RepID=UPI003DA95D65